MAKQRVEFRCEECGASAPRWSGRCPACDEWNTMVEAPVLSIARSIPAGGRSSSRRRRSARSSSPRCSAMPTGISELDRVLGGGFVPGSVTLIGGEPGVGKSTLLTQVAASHGVRRRRRAVRVGRGVAAAGASARRTGSARSRRSCGSRPRPSSGTCSPRSTGAAEPRRDRLDPDRARSGARFGAGIDGAGPRVRAPARARGEATRSRRRPRRPRHEGRRPRRSTRARARRRHRAVLRRRPPSRLAPAARREAPVRLDRRARAVRDDRRTGSCPCPTRARCSSPTGDRASRARPWCRRSTATARCSSRSKRWWPRRTCRWRGDLRRVSTVGGSPSCSPCSNGAHSCSLTGSDVFALAVGGVRVVEPGADLALALAVASSLSDTPLPADLVACAEVGLGGELRQVGQTPRRLAEAARLGFATRVAAAFRARSACRDCGAAPRWRPSPRRSISSASSTEPHEHRHVHWPRS